MAIEFLDIFNENMEHLGNASRDEVHTKGLWHQTFHCWLIRHDKKSDKKFVLFQRRGPHKKVYPNYLDITAAGHITSGETPEDGIRELKEELGIDVDFNQLIFLGTRVEVAIVGDVLNREFSHTYFYHSDLELNKYSLEVDEVTSLVEIEINDGLDLFSGIKEKVTAKGYEVIANNLIQKVEILVSIQDIIPRNLDKYYLKVFIMAERYFNGKRQLAI